MHCELLSMICILEDYQFEKRLQDIDVGVFTLSIWPILLMHNCEELFRKGHDKVLPYKNINTL
jgi:hypothetical protein